MRKIVVLFCLMGLLGTLIWQSNAKGDNPDGTDQEKSNVAAARAQTSQIGRKINDFVLADSKGKKIGLSDFAKSRLLVVVFMGTECPIGNAYVPDLIDIQTQNQGKGVQVLGINSNLSDSAETVATHAREYNLNFPVLIDKDQTVADLFGARRTPEVFVLDAQRAIQYRGRIDDRFGYVFKNEKSRRDDLKVAVSELLSGKKVSTPETEIKGCLITRKRRAKSATQITFNKHVAKILHKRCADCHHADTAAPMSLLTYEHAKNWSEMIKETVVQRRMPPWNADPRFGKFSNDLRMTNEEIDTLIRWVDSGAPEGDSKDLPKTPEFADGWMIGKPDITFKMPVTYKVKAKGTVKYQHFETETNFKEDVWIQAAEARPGNRAVVHHIIVFYKDPKSPGRRRSIVGIAPGEEPMIWPKGIGMRIPAGAKLIWQLHYTPTGKAEEDQSEVGFVLCKEKPEREAKGKMAMNGSFKIPPNHGNYEVKSSTRFAGDAELLSLMPHMHLRGKDFRYIAHFPDGSSKTLLNVPNYDFNWQHRYRLAKPLFVPAGTRIECIAHFDNSASNPANPNPNERVKWGDQTWEEMMIGFINYVDAKKK